MNPIRNPIRIDFETAGDTDSLTLAVQVSKLQKQLADELSSFRTEKDNITVAFKVSWDSFTVVVYTRYSGSTHFQFSESDVSDDCVEKIVDAVNQLASKLKTKEQWQKGVTENLEAFVTKMRKLVEADSSVIGEKISLDYSHEMEKGVGGTVKCGDTHVQYGLVKRRETVCFRLTVGDEKVVVTYQRLMGFLRPALLEYTYEANVKPVNLLDPSFKSLESLIAECLKDIERIKARLRTKQAFQRP